jgi:LysR family cyn operon transcriptional activator
MELRQLRYFLKAAETLNFTEAAREVFISQSTLSQQIKQLEIELGSPLFDRIGKKIALTKTGQTFRSYASQCLYNAKQGHQAVMELNNIEQGEINVGVTYALSSLITKAIVSFNLQYPKVKLNVVFGTTSDLLQRLKNLEIDVVCSFLAPSMHDSSLHVELLLESPLMMVTSKSSAFAERKSVSLLELSTVPMVLPDRGFGTRQYLDRLMAKNRLSPVIDIEINDIPTLFRLLETGKWVTVLTKITVAEQPNLIAIPIKETDAPQEAYIVKLNDVYHPKSIEEFCKLLK